eukprot:gene2085-2404_t
MLSAGRFPQLIGSIVLSYLLLASDASTAAARVVQTTEAGQNVGAVSDKEVDERRRKAHFRRAHDGHVAIQNKYTQQWSDIKCDLQVPGLLLVRESDGQGHAAANNSNQGEIGVVYYIGYAGLKQIDLSDDLVVAAVAADTWEDNIRAVQAQAEDGGVESLELTREGFYELVSLVSGEDDEQAAASAADEGRAARASGKQQTQASTRSR